LPLSGDDSSELNGGNVPKPVVYKPGADFGKQKIIDI